PPASSSLPRTTRYTAQGKDPRNYIGVKRSPSFSVPLVARTIRHITSSDVIRSTIYVTEFIYYDLSLVSTVYSTKLNSNPTRCRTLQAAKHFRN
uniref:Uncharacterized protein n=1 Tax=Ciona intestinalis TaxID=7719 RepID=H2XSY6_CIOIN